MSISKHPRVCGCVLLTASLVCISDIAPNWPMSAVMSWHHGVSSSRGVQAEVQGTEMHLSVSGHAIELPGWGLHYFLLISVGHMTNADEGSSSIEVRSDVSWSTVVVR